MNNDWGYKVTPQTILTAKSYIYSQIYYRHEIRMLQEYENPGGHSAHTHTGGLVQEIFKQPKNITPASLQPKYQLVLYLETSTWT